MLPTRVPTSCRRLLVALLLLLTGGSALPAAASADSATVRFTDASGKVDPVVGLGRTFSVTGNVSSPKRLYVLVRPAGGAACAPSPRSDTANSTYFGSFSGDDLYGASVDGNFTRAKTGNWSSVGTFQFCVWLSPDAETPTVPITSIITFRNSGGTISATLNPTTPAPDQTTTITVTGSSEAPAEVYATMRPAGVPCAPSYRADTGASVLYSRDVNGTFSITDTFTPSARGPHVLCLYLAKSDDDASPIAVQAVSFDVIAPCVVPAIEKGASVQAAQQALVGAGCALGMQRLIADPKVARGAVVSAATPAGTTLGPGAAIELLVSDGRACKVPSSKPGLRKSQAKTRLTQLGCTVGKVTRVRSKRKKGTVVRFTPRAGTQLAPRAVVDIVVSKGRR